VGVSSIRDACEASAHKRLLSPKARNAAGFSGNSATASPTAVLGLRYYGLKDAGGNAWSTAGLPATFYALSDAQNAALYGSRAIIYGANPVSDGAGSSYPSIVWPLITTY
jgi:hypothetical protein